MWFWWFMLACGLLIPVLMMIGGRIMWKHCPRNINGFVGYRTARSMKNMDTWEFAHEYCGRLWWRVGLTMLLPSALLHIPFYCSSENTIGIVGIVCMIVQCAVLIASIFPTEAALEKNFHDDGTRR